MRGAQQEGRIEIPVLLEEVHLKLKGVQAKLSFNINDRAIRRALCDAQGHNILIVVGENREPELPLGDPPIIIDAPIVARDESTPSAGQLTNLEREREAALEDPFTAGKAAAHQGFNETRNPLNPNSPKGREWLRGHAEGEGEREALRAAATKRPRRRRRRGNGQEQAMPAK